MKIDLKKGGNHYTHGLSGSALYVKYYTVLKRCTNPNQQNYALYGGRGIECKWQTFEEFYKDMHISYFAHVKKYGTRETTLERIDNNGNYSKENCRWATTSQQARNRRSNKLFTYRGKTLCLAEWAEFFNINYYILQYRLSKNKMPFEQAISYKR